MNLVVVAVTMAAVACLPGCLARTRWRAVSPRKRIAGRGGCFSPEGMMEFGQRLYLPGCRRLVCKTFIGMPIIEEQFCDPLPEAVPNSCIVSHRPHRRHPDCCPSVICSSGTPALTGGLPGLQGNPEREAPQEPIFASGQYKTKIRNGPYGGIVGRLNTPWQPILGDSKLYPVPVTPPSIYMTTEIIYGKGFSDPWDGGQLSATEEDLLQYKNHRLPEPSSPWEEQASFALDSPSNSIRTPEDKDETEAYSQGKEGSLTVGENTQKKAKTQPITVGPQHHNSGSNTTQATDVSYWHFFDASEVRTSPMPFPEYANYLPIAKLFSTTLFPKRLTESKVTTESVPTKPVVRYTPWEAIVKTRTTLPSVPTTKFTTPTTPSMSWSIKEEKEDVSSSSTSTSRYYPTKENVQQTTPLYIPTRREQKKTYAPSKSPAQVRTTMTAINAYKRRSRRPTQGHRLAKRPGTNKITSTPKPAMDSTRTVPASYEFATPKLNPREHDIHEFILTPLDPSKLIPGHDEYLESKFSAIREYSGSDEEKQHSKKNRRSLPYTEATMSYEHQTTLPYEYPTEQPEESTSSLPPSTTDVPTTESMRQKRGRPVFYIPWRQNLVSQPTTPDNLAEDYKEDLLASAKSFPPPKFERFIFYQSENPVTEESLINDLSPAVFTTTNAGSPDTETPNSQMDQMSTPSSEPDFHSSPTTTERLDVKNEINVSADNKYMTEEVSHSNENEIILLDTTTVGPATALATAGSTTGTSTTPSAHLQQTTTRPAGVYSTASPLWEERDYEKVSYSMENHQEENYFGNPGGDHTTTPGPELVDIPLLRQSVRRRPSENAQGALGSTGVPLISETQEPQFVWSPPPFRTSRNRSRSSVFGTNHVSVPYYGSYPDIAYLEALKYEPRKQDSGSLNTSSTKLNTVEAKPEDEDATRKNVATTTPSLSHQPREEVEARSNPVISNSPVEEDTGHDGLRRQDQSQMLEVDDMTDDSPDNATGGTTADHFDVDGSEYTTTDSSMPDTLEEMEESLTESEADTDPYDIPDETSFEDIEDTVSRDSAGPDINQPVQQEPESQDVWLHGPPASTSEQNTVPHPPYSERPALTGTIENTRLMAAEMPSSGHWTDDDHDDPLREDWSGDTDLDPTLPPDDYNMEENEEEESSLETELRTMLKSFNPTEADDVEEEYTPDLEVSVRPLSSGRLPTPLPAISRLQPIPLLETVQPQQPVTARNPRARQPVLISSRASRTQFDTQFQTSPLPETSTTEYPPMTASSTRARISSRYRSTPPSTTQLNLQTQPSAFDDLRSPTTEYQVETSTQTSTTTTEVSISPSSIENETTTHRRPASRAPTRSPQNQRRTYSRGRLPPQTTDRNEVTPPPSRPSRRREPTHQGRRLSRVTTPQDLSEDLGPQPATTHPPEPARRSRPVDSSSPRSSPSRGVASFMYKSMIHRPARQQQPQIERPRTSRSRSYVRRTTSARQAPPASSREPPASPGQPPASPREPPAFSREPQASVREPPASPTEPTAFSRHPPASPTEPTAFSRHPPASPTEPTAFSRHPSASPTEPTAFPRHPPAFPREPTAFPRHPPPSPREPTAFPRHPPPSPREPTAFPRHPPASPREPTAFPRPLSASYRQTAASSRGPPAPTKDISVSTSRPSTSTTTTFAPLDSLFEFFPEKWEPMRET